MLAASFETDLVGWKKQIYWLKFTLHKNLEFLLTELMQQRQHWLHVFLHKLHKSLHLSHASHQWLWKLEVTCISRQHNWRTWIDKFAQMSTTTGLYITPTMSSPFQSQPVNGLKQTSWLWSRLEVANLATTDMNCAMYKCVFIRVITAWLRIHAPSLVYVLLT